MRKVKALGLALVAVFAMSAIVASGASAQTTHTFTSEAETTFLKGASEEGTKDKFTVSSIIGTLAIECTGNFTGTQTGKTADTVDVTPSYENCTFNGEAASVDVPSNCHYHFGSDTNANGHAAVSIAGCPSETATTGMIAVTNNTCDMYFTNQNTEEGVTYTNITENGKGAVTVKSTVKATIKEKQATSTCFGTANTGTYESTANVTGYSDSGHTKQVSISVSSP